MALVHGHNRRGKQTTTYRAWRHMIERCSNPNTKGFSRYGGRGIQVCESWQKFINFLANMGLCPEGLTLERIDNDGGYKPDNCKWATWVEQNANKSHHNEGEFHGCHKLIWKEVTVIRELKRRSCPVTQTRLAEWFEVDQSTISRILHGKRWRKTV